MAMYMYPIKIEQEKQVRKLFKKHYIRKELLTLRDILKFVKDDQKFEIRYNEIDCLYVLTVYFERLETDAEQIIRIKRQQEYMENYNKFHANKDK